MDYRVRRAIAADEVQLATVEVNGYQAVDKLDALRLLGEERLAELLADKIRCLGPTKDTIYPWNVIDYLTRNEPETNPQ